MQHASPARSRRRYVFIVIGIVAFQAMVLLAGGYVLFRSASRQVSQGLVQLIETNNVRVAESLSDLITESVGRVDRDIVYGSPEWERVQSIIEGFEFSGDGFACVLDTEGLIVAHPDIRQDPSLRNVNLARETLLTDQGPTALGDASQTDGAGQWVTFKGEIDFGVDGTHYVATRRLGDSPVRIVVHQPVAGIEAAKRQAFGRVGANTAALGLVVIGATTAGMFFLIRRHDRATRGWNQTLEGLVDDRTTQLGRSRNAVLVALAELAEKRDDDTGQHVERISAYAEVLANRLRPEFDEIDDTFLAHLKVAAKLHDVGKVAVDDRVLRKPGKLTDDEYKHIQTHTTSGPDVLMTVRRELADDDMLDMSIHVALYHHEKWNGKGYPMGLQGEEIPLSARIVAVCDVFDALSSKRVYKPAMPREKVRAIILEESGAHFDPQVVAAFKEVEPELVRIRKAMADPDAEGAPAPVRVEAPAPAQ
ncbi:MAG: HD domain-containing phosphohydrolase [Planctomycetota bacterium]